MADPTVPGPTGAHLLSAVNEDKLRRILARMLDEERFLSPHGLRALSRWHLDHPYEFDVHGQAYTVALRTGRVDVGDVRRQLELARAGVDAGEHDPHPRAAAVRRLLRRFVHPGVPDRIGQSSGRCAEIAVDLTERVVIASSPRTPTGAARCTAAPRSSRTTRTGSGLLQFYEYFHGDNGAGLGASHQTGWTGVIANYIQLLPQLEAGSIDLTQQWPMATYYRRPLA